MQYHRLGRTGLMVSELSLGTMIFGEESERSTPSDVAKNLLSRFFDAGGNFIDTANVYADGRSERIIGEWLQGYPRDEIIIATKVRGGRGSGVNQEGLSRHHIMTEVENSLRRLQTDYIDLYYAHLWDEATPLAETLRALDDLVRTGTVRYIGVSNFKAWQLMKALALSDAHGWERFVAAQYQYSLVTRDIEHEFLDLFQTEGLGQCVWGPLGGGFLTGKYSKGQRPDEGRISSTPAEYEEAWERRATERNWRIVDAVDDIAEKYAATHAQVALRWLLTRPAMASVIIGVRTMSQLEDNLGAVDVALDEDDITRLTEVSMPPDLYPYRMIEAYSGRQNR